MSELKAYIAPTPDGTGLADYYLKSEADKVITEKDEKIDSLNREIARIQDKMCEDVFEGIMPSEHIVCLPLRQAAECIAELEKKLDIYKRGWEESDRINAHLYAKLRHHKYKRCLAMANWCMTEYLHSKCLDFTNTEQWYWRRWHIRWRNLAEKFKSNNQTAQQGKGK